MNSKVPKWMPRESAGCFPNRLEGASQNNEEERSCLIMEQSFHDPRNQNQNQMDSCRKRPSKTLDSEGGVEEFLRLLERIEETKKRLKRNRSMNCIGSSSAGVAVEKDQTMNMMPGMEQQAQGSGSDFVSLTTACKGTSSPWKPSFQLEDFNINPSLSVQTDLSCAATTEKSNSYIINTAAVFMSSTEENHKGRGGSIQIGNGQLKTRTFLDVIADTPAGCSHDHVDDLDNKEDVADAPLELELRLFPI